MDNTRTLGELLPRAAERDGGAPAVHHGGLTLTWADAAVEAARLGAALDLAGVGPGDRVGVHLRKSPEAFLAMHAVVQRGAIAVPFDPTAASAYLAGVAERTGCAVVVTHAPCRRSALALAAGDQPTVRTVVGLAPGDDATGVRCIGPDEIADLEPVAPRPVDPDQPAYIITTSGSTGTPKGITHTHASALAYVDFKRAAYDLEPSDRISDIAPNHFDISTLALWVTPAVGAANVVVPEPHQMLPASLSQLAADEGITVWYSVPYLLTQLLHRGQLDQKDLTALRWVLFGGEMFPPQVLAALMARWPGARFSNVYGPAEVNACTVHHLDAPPLGEDPIPVGRPVDTTEVRLVDLDTPDGPGTGGEPAPGRSGEIWVCARTMMAGYWERPDLDAATIVTDTGGRRWYRTGDLGYRRPGGELVFTGRVDHQVKVRGHRIELEAIEAVLEDVPGVANAVAAVARPGDGADVIVAGLVTSVEAAGPPDADALRRHAARYLPAYAIPVAFLPITALPTTGSGKLDRRAIRAELAARCQPEGK
ncbi:MAG: AMP-binding protein [Acidimicrobiia bacterium]|nr:AMP-binding protein [Acidimicrobiia bacterium]